MWHTRRFRIDPTIENVRSSFPVKQAGTVFTTTENVRAVGSHVLSKRQPTLAFPDVSELRDTEAVKEARAHPCAQALCEDLRHHACHLR